MKKVIALMIAMVLVLSLAACGGSSGSNSESSDETNSKYTTVNMVGIWYSDSDLSLRLLKGGTAQMVYKQKFSNWSDDIRSRWEIKDDCIVITSSMSEGEPYYDTFEIVDENTIKYINDINTNTVLKRQ